MSTTLSYGYKKPQTGDKGSVFYPDLEFDIQRLNDHTHNGSDSAALTSTSILPATHTVSNAGWAAVSGQTGTYKQTVTMPSSTAFDTHTPSFRNNSTNEILYLSAVKVSSNTYDVFINDNTITLKVNYNS